MTFSPREALRKLIAVLDLIEKSNCQVCIQPSNMTAECKVHGSKFKRALREAREALVASNN